MHAIDLQLVSVDLHWVVKNLCRLVCKFENHQSQRNACHYWLMQLIPHKQVSKSYFANHYTFPINTADFDKGNMSL